MLKTYFKILWRNLAKNKVYALINVFGLAIGISASTLISLYIVDELSYDKQHEKRDRIYRITTKMDFNGVMDAALTNYAVAPTLKQNYPDVESYARFFAGGQEFELEIDKRIFKSDKIWFTDSTLFDVFSYDFIQGNPQSALKAPNSIVLTESMSQKLFGNLNSIGQQMRLNNFMLTVQGIIKDPPKNSEIEAKAFVSINTLPQGFHDNFNQDWFRISFYSFVLMRKAIEPGDFKNQLAEINTTYVVPWAEANGIVAGHEYALTPLSDLHFDSSHEFDLPKGKMSNIYIFSILAIFLLLIASFNYINLSLAQQNKRAKEVGIRKTLGSSRKSLILQFIFESALVTFIAVVLGLALTELFMGKFNEISGKMVCSFDLFSWPIILTLFGIFLLIGFLAGAYPAFVLSSLKPITVISGNYTHKGSIGFFRKTLILFQFLFSLFMILGTFMIGDQIEFIRSKNLGFDRENLISITLPSDTASRRIITPWIQELENNAGIVSFSNSALPSGGSAELMFRIEKQGQMLETTVKCLFVDDKFLEVLGLDLEKGRNFSEEIQTDVTSAFIVNKTAAKAFLWEDEALNKRVQWGLLENGGATNDGVVVGVIQDFNFMTLHNPLEPLILCYNPNAGNNLSVRLAKGDYTETLRTMEDNWNGILSTYPFDYSFFSQDLETNYGEELKMHTIFSYFSMIAIILASLGLFSLLSYSIQSRSREIGIRMVLGASIPGLAWIIAKDFFFLMLVAFIIACPFVYVLWGQWLEDYAYQSPVNVLSFILTIGLAFLLSSIAVIYHGWKISGSNPLDSIRIE